MPKTSTTTPAKLSLDMYCLQGLSMNTNIDSFFSIPDPTSLHNIEIGGLLKEDLEHMRHFQEKVMGGGDRTGLAKELLWYDLTVT